MVPRRFVVFAAAAPLALVLATGLSGCGSIALFLGGAATPTATASASETPEALPTEQTEPTPTPSATQPCVNRTISSPGSYSIDGCANLTLQGSGNITVTAGELRSVTITGDSLQLYAQSIARLDVQGKLNTVQTTDQLDSLTISGSRNEITSHAGIDSVRVSGDDNTITADGGIGTDIQDTGQRNTISAQP